LDETLKFNVLADVPHKSFYTGQCPE